MTSLENRREMFKSFGKRLEAELDLVSLGNTDTQIQGESGERSFRNWLNEQLPKRFHAASGAVISANNPPTTQRDCVIFDSSDCPVFRQVGGQPDLYPIEGAVGCIEINTGKSGAPYEKLLHDCEKLSEVGQLGKDRRPLLPNTVRLSPVNVQNRSTIPDELFVLHQSFLLPPILYIFAEKIRGSLPETARRIMIHNKSVAIGASVDGVFVLDEGFILHCASNEGWHHHRLPGMPLAYMKAEPWEVLLKMISIVWNHLWKGPYLSADLGAYYADKNYFIANEMPRVQFIDDQKYQSQQEEGFVTIST